MGEIPSNPKCGGLGYVEKGNETDKTLLPIVVNKTKKIAVKIITEKMETKLIFFNAGNTIKQDKATHTKKYVRDLPIETKPELTVSTANETSFLTC